MMSRHPHVLRRGFSSLGSKLSGASKAGHKGDIHPPWLTALLERPTELKTWEYDCPVLENGQKRPQPDPSDPRRIHIIGAGNLGRLFAMALAQLPERPPITLIVRQAPSLDAWTAKPGISLTVDGEVLHNADFDLKKWTALDPQKKPGQRPNEPPVTLTGPIHNLIIATKADDAVNHVDRVRTLLGPKSNVLFLQNGMNKLWPPHGKMYTDSRFPDGSSPTFMTCVVRHGVTSNGGFFNSTLAAPQDAVFGTMIQSRAAASGVDAEDNYLAKQILAAPMLNASKVPRRELWVRQLEKLVVNSVLNPLTAVLRCKNGELIEESALKETGRIIDALLREASDILEALVHHKSSAEIFEGPSLDASKDKGAVLERVSYPALRSLFFEVTTKAGANTSSMLQDTKAKRTTEVRELNGWFMNMAVFLNAGHDVLTHEALLYLVEDNQPVKASQLREKLGLLKLEYNIHERRQRDLKGPMHDEAVRQEKLKALIRSAYTKTGLRDRSLRKPSTGQS